MKVAVITNKQLKNEFLVKGVPDYANVCFVEDPQNIPADTYIVFDLLFEHTHERICLLQQFLPRPVIINAVSDTLAAIGQPFIRINAWPTFLKRSITEAAVLTGQEQMAQEAFEKLNWPYQLLPDLTGMVSARITAMIINEAYFTLAEKVGSKDAIDEAMQLGTGYPYGPFEWSKLIGLTNIYTLLLQLNKEDQRYEVSALLATEAAAI